MGQFHPAVVHFPIALTIIALFLCLLYLIFKKNSLLWAIHWNLDLAAVAAIVAVITGNAAEEAASHTQAVHELLETHETLGLIAMWVLLAIFVLRRLLPSLKDKLPALYLLVILMGAALVGTNGYIGGKMVFEHGLGVKAGGKLDSSSGRSGSLDKSAQDDDENSPDHEHNDDR